MLTASKRPLLMRVLPLWLRLPLYYRLYHRRASAFTALFDGASLAARPSVRLRLSPGDVAHGPIAFTGAYERALTGRLRRMAGRGGLLVDVGANAGYFTTLWAGTRAGNRVIAFEPVPQNLELLQENVRRNGLANQVDIRPVALGAVPGTLPFRRGPAGQTGQGGLAGPGESGELEIEVQRLDDALAGVREPIAVLKIDTEGADTWVLQGAVELLRSGRIESIYFEQYPTRMRALGIRPGEAQALLAGAGYRVRRLEGDEWWARRAT